MASIDISVRCGNCGNKLEADVDFNHREALIEVELCEDCEKEFETEIDKLEVQIENLESQIEQLEETLKNMEMFK